MLNLMELFQQDDPVAVLRRTVSGYTSLQKQEIYWELEALRLDANNQIDSTIFPEICAMLGKFEEKAIDRFQMLFWQALQREDPASALRQVVIHLRGEGVSKGMLLSQLEVVRKQIASEPEEDVVARVMDFLVGWCSPYMRID